MEWIVWVGIGLCVIAVFVDYALCAAAGNADEIDGCK
jgi:hypothetical protein